MRELKMLHSGLFLGSGTSRGSLVAPEIMLFDPCDVLKQLGYADSPEALL